MRLTVSGGRAEAAGGGEEEAQSCPEPRRPHGTSNIHRSEEGRAAAAAALLPALHVWGEAAADAAAAARDWWGRKCVRESEGRGRVG